jgi:hypothetical protein
MIRSFAGSELKMCSIVLLAELSAPGARRAAAGEACGGRPGGRRPFPDDDDLIDEIAARIAAEAASLRKICPWCVATLKNGEAFCSPYCAEMYEKRLMPAIGDERIGISRPAPRESVAALHLAGKAARDERRWLAAHPHEAP